MANNVKLTVCGMELYISSDDDASYVQSVGSEVNHKIQQMLRENNFLSVSMAAVYAALEYCDESKRTKIDTEQLNSKIKALSDELATARLESDEARREIERLNKENQTLRGRLSRQ